MLLILYHDTNIQTVHTYCCIHGTVHTIHICTVTAVCTCTVCMYSNQRMDQPGKVTKPARGQLNRKNEQLPVSVRA